jgi:hypothetical protein
MYAGGVYRGHDVDGDAARRRGRRAPEHAHTRRLAHSIRRREVPVRVTQRGPLLARRTAARRRRVVRALVRGDDLDRGRRAPAPAERPLGGARRRAAAQRLEARPAVERARLGDRGHSARRRLCAAPPAARAADSTSGGRIRRDADEVDLGECRRVRCGRGCAAPARGIARPVPARGPPCVRGRRHRQRLGAYWPGAVVVVGDGSLELVRRRKHDRRAVLRERNKAVRRDVVPRVVESGRGIVHDDRVHLAVVPVLLLLSPAIFLLLLFAEAVFFLAEPIFFLSTPLFLLPAPTMGVLLLFAPAMLFLVFLAYALFFTPPLVLLLLSSCIFRAPSVLFFSLPRELFLPLLEGFLLLALRLGGRGLLLGALSVVRIRDAVPALGEPGHLPAAQALGEPELAALLARARHEALLPDRARSVARGGGVRLGAHPRLLDAVEHRLRVLDLAPRAVELDAEQPELLACPRAVALRRAPRVQHAPQFACERL